VRGFLLPICLDCEKIDFMKIISFLNKLFFVYFWLAIPKIAYAWDTYDLPESTPNPNDPGAAKFSSFEFIFERILGLLIPFAGIVIFVMLLVGGLGFLTSGGNPEKTAKASQTITWSIIGLLLLIGAWLILRFIETFTGVRVTMFAIPQ
jgi:Type IV secretion system pilin